MTGKYFAFILFFFISHFQSQEYYSELRNKYWEFEENDVRALPYINLYIKSAKREKNNSELFQAYSDAIMYSRDKKLHYADSALVVAKLSGNHNLLGNAYMGKGSVYYFTFRKFKPALNEYLLAYKYLEHSEDHYLKYRSLYYIAVVKSYLGYNEEAADIFKKCISYFKINTKGNLHQNVIFNNRKGYFNSLHQLIVCEQAMGNYNHAIALTTEGFKEIPKGKEFDQELSYFYKNQGINAFHHKKFSEAILHLEKSIAGLKKVKDFSWVSTIYYYLGLSYKNKGNINKAVEHYKKVDSIFVKHHFIFPQTRNNYEELISYYRKQADPQQELYYTKQLLKVDSVISNDFKYLTTRIHKEFDTKALLQTQANLENSNNKNKKLLILLAVSIVLLLVLLFYWFRRKNYIQKKYDLILEELNLTSVEDISLPIKISNDEKNIEKTSKLDSSTITILKHKFKEFEKNKRFLEKGITAGRLAAEFETNATYFSQFVSEFKDSNFNTYINNLRIIYAVDQIYNHKEWRKYSVEDIASACGFSSRQSFSNVFYEQKGIRPAEFLKKRNEELMAERKQIEKPI